MGRTLSFSLMSVDTFMSITPCLKPLGSDYLQKLNKLDSGFREPVIYFVPSTYFHYQNKGKIGAILFFLYT